MCASFHMMMTNLYLFENTLIIKIICGVSEVQPSLFIHQMMWPNLQILNSKIVLEYSYHVTVSSLFLISVLIFGWCVQNTFLFVLLGSSRA